MEPEDSNYNKNADEDSYRADTGEHANSSQLLEAYSPPISLEKHLDALTNQRRRHVIRLLAGNAPRSLRNLTSHIAGFESGESVDNVSGAERKRVYVGLYQTHLPALDAVHIIDWSESEATATRGPEFDRAVAILDAAEDAYAGDDVEPDDETDPHEGLACPGGDAR